MKYAFSIAALAAVGSAGPVVTKRQAAAAVTDGPSFLAILYDPC